MTHGIAKRWKFLSEEKRQQRLKMVRDWRRRNPDKVKEYAREYYYNKVKFNPLLPTRKCLRELLLKWCEK